MQNKATELFSDWADIGKDEGMAKTHSLAVNQILDQALSGNKSHFNFIDAGCGNGWVVRMLSERNDCSVAIGVDGAPSMIANALASDPDGMYYCANLMDWSPSEPVDIVHSMEVFYYLKDIPEMLRIIKEKWLTSEGILAFGVDHYAENEESLTWSDKVGVRMTTHSENEWKTIVETAGFDILRCFRAAPSGDWPGTLSFVARVSN